MKRSCVISMCGYDGGLQGISLGDHQRAKDPLPDLTTGESLKDILVEYTVTDASESSIQCVDGVSNLLALGGYDEVIHLYDV